jgi:hypothetical protein
MGTAGGNRVFIVDGIATGVHFRWYGTLEQGADAMAGAATSVRTYNQAENDLQN